MKVPDVPTELSPVAGKVGGTRVVPWTGSFVGLLEINKLVPKPLAVLSAKNKLSPVGLTCPLGLALRLNSIR